MLHLDLQTFLIIHAVFVNSFYLLHSLDYEFTWVYALAFTGFDTTRTVQNRFATAMLIEIF